MPFTGGVYVAAGDINNDLANFLHKPFYPERTGWSIESITSQIRSTFPGGADVAVVVPSPRVGFSVVPNSKGIIAVLIGLLLPAVQKLQPGSPELGKLRAAVKPSGRVGVLPIEGLSMNYERVRFD